MLNFKKITGSQQDGLEKVKLNGRFQIRFQPSTNRKTIEVFIDPKGKLLSAVVFSTVILLTLSKADNIDCVR